MDGSISFVWFKNILQMNVPYFYCHQLNDLDNKRFPKQQLVFFSEASLFNNGHLESVALSPKNNNPNISSKFLIIAKFLFMFCSWITSSSSLDMSFLLGVIYVLETLLWKIHYLIEHWFLGKIKGTDFWDNNICYCNSKTSIVGSN